MVRKAKIVNIQRGLKQSRLYKNKQVTPDNFASNTDLLIPDAAFGDIEENSKIELADYFHSEGQGFTVQVNEIADIASLKIDASEGTSTTYGSITGALDGSRVIFNGSAESYVSGSAEVYLNQQKQVKGTDFTESDSVTCEITMTIAPVSTDILVLAYQQNAFKLELVYATSNTENANNTVSGVINGSNKVFTCPGPYKTGTLRVYLNGGLQTQGSTSDWTETSPSAGTFTFITAPDSPDVVSASYEAVDGSRRQENTAGTLSYTFNGTNKRGTTSGPYEPGTLELSRQGQLLTPAADYVETDPASGYFDTIEAFASGVLSAVYTVGDNASPRNEPGPIIADASTRTLSVYDRISVVSTASAAVTLTTPAAADIEGVEFYIKKADSSANAIVVETPGAETFDGSGSLTSNTQYSILHFVSDGTNFAILYNDGNWAAPP